MGWKDILRPIRDGLRDNLPSKEPAHDGEVEKLRQRDALKGFTYFHSFQEVDDWQPHQVRGFQRANTPLLSRVGPFTNNKEQNVNITLIHDSGGAYHDYESAQGFFVDRESYSCNYMQCIDSFVYFSHKLVCVPPPSWTNCLHRNGVRSLGTFLVEPQTPNISSILHRHYSLETHTWEYALATKLIHMAQCYGFDGWLLNIEKTFALMDWSCEYLEGFLTQLSSAFGDGCVIWYDSLTINNRIKYQNGLTEQNLRFAQAAGAILTNYAWTPEKARKSGELAVQHGMNPQHVMCGIDVWAQNSQVPEQTRKTYPRDGGGGTGTGLGMAELTGLNLSVGLFAPAWPYEHFSSCSDAVERSMWTGEALPNPTNCNCTPSDRHAAQRYQNHPILRYAQEYPAGSETFFYTNFMKAFQASEDMEDRRIVANLGSQAILPLSTVSEIVKQADGALYCHMESNPARAVISSRSQRGPTHMKHAIQMFRLSMTLATSLMAKIVFQKPKTPTQLNIWITFEGTRLRIPVTDQACARAVLEVNLDNHLEEGTLYLSGVSVVVEGPLSGSDDTWHLLDVLEMCIKPKNKASRNYSIDDVTLKGENQEQRRLCWRFSNTSGSVEDDGMPYSDLTGPFSFFEIVIDGHKMGRAFAPEFVVQNMDEKAEIGITGVGFDGETICTYTGGADSMERQGSIEGWQLV